MSSERHARAKEIFLAACDLDAAPRAAFVEERCAGDRELLDAVHELLANDAHPLASLDQPVAERLAAELFEDDHELPPPERIGSYRVIRLLGRGGMGAVYEVEQENPRRRVALKIVATGAGSRGSLRRLRHEAQILARLKHPGIAQIHEAGSSEVYGVVQPWFVMELVEGATLLDHARRARLELAARAALVADVCDAVQHAHEAGVLHCDLKGANVVVDAQGRPKVIDFGVARVLERVAGTDGLTTATGSLAGTLATMSPEHVAGGPRDLDERSDVYALGVITYELLTGRPPLDVTELSVPEAVRRICEDPPPRAGSLVPELGGDLETILAKALAKDREQRYASARALADDLRRWIAGRPIAARPLSAAYRLRLFARRNRVLSAVAAVSAAALLVLAGFAVRSWQRESALRSQSATVADGNVLLAAQRAVNAGDPALARTLLASLRTSSAGWERRRLRRELEGWIAEYPTHERVVEIGFSPDSSQAFAAGHSGAFWRVNALTGQELGRLAGAPARERTVAALPDGSGCLAFGQRELVLWDSATGAAIRTLPLDPTASADPRGAARFSPSGRWLATRGRVFDLWAPDAPPLSVQAGYVAFSRDPEVIASQDQRITVDDLETGRRLFAVDVTQPARALALDPAARRLVASDETHVHVTDLATGARRTLSAAHAHAPNALAFRPDGARLVALQDDGSFLVHDPDADRVVLRGRVGRSSWKSMAAWSADGALLLTAGWSSGELRVWDARDDAEVLHGHESFVYPVAYTPDGQRIVSGSWDRTVRVWCAATNELLATLEGHTGHRVHALAVSPDSESLVSAGEDGALVLWDLGTGAQRARHAGSRRLGAVAWGRGGRIASGEEDPGAAVILHNAADLTPVGSLSVSERGVTALAFSPDGRRLAAGMHDGTLAIWDLERGGQPVTATLQGYVRSVAFAPDGQELVAATEGRIVCVLDSERAAVRLTLRGHAREAFSAAFSPDGTRIASGGRDGLLRLWDVEGGAELGAFEGHTSYIWSLAFHPEGARIVTGSGDGTVRQWESEPVPATFARRTRRVAAAAGAGALLDRLAGGRDDPRTLLDRLAAEVGLSTEERWAARNELLRRSSAPR
ncbi:MAG: protein kinase [Planctomycetes bacterium]|nr:protein kinase [Planctomycetota bacterium]